MSTAPRLDQCLLELDRLGPSKVLTGTGCEAYACDDSIAVGQTPCAVVFAETTGDIEHTLRTAAAHNVPVTPRGAGSGRVGGATTVHGGIVLCPVGMNQIKDIDRREQVAVVGPGVVCRRYTKPWKRKACFIRPTRARSTRALLAAMSPPTPVAHVPSSTA